MRFRREMATSDRPALFFLVVFTVVCTITGLLYPDFIPFVTLLLPMFIGSLWLGPRSLPWFIVFVCACVVVLLLDQPTVSLRTLARAGVTFAIALLIMVTSFGRSRLGVSGPRGESMFVDLRDRILQQGGIPDLPPGWHAESALRSAGGTAFAGDFVVATLASPTRLELAVIDVSGKGEEAGTRALLLSGAFGGLMGTLPPDQFLPAANSYLLRQNWSEGFATALHLSLDLDDGSFEIRTAGHPPAALRQAGTGRWTVLPSEGPILGLMEDAVFRVAAGRLVQHDALLLYTDGMVEEPRLDIDLGIDRMLGEAEHLLRGSFEGAARRLVDALGSRDDDRAMVVISRS
jgi:hypothetical protein